jgi:sphingomyelin phosphodiesterase
MPAVTLRSMFEYVRDSVKPDIIVWTGDNSAHVIWSNTPEEVLDSTHNITKIFREVFDGTKVTIIPINGNHDVWPANNQEMLKPYSSQYILEYGRTWKEAGWLNDEDLAVYNKWGYYSKTLELKDGRRYNNTKIIAINTMSCYYYNFLIVKSRFDPGDQIAWLEQELAALEASNGQAMLIGHIPPFYYECMHGWSHRLKALLDRYQHVVRFGMYGHQHEEWVQTYSSVRNSQQRIGLSFLAGSATTFYKMNPGFSMYEVDEEYMIPVNSKTYFYNMTLAELEPHKPPQWQ